MANLDRDYYLDKEGLRTLINALETNIIADEYGSSVLYSVDQYCIYENSLYKCIAITSGAWDSSAWSKIIIGDELLSKANRDDVQEAIDEVVADIGDTSEANAMNHLGFYLDANGGLCQVNSI